LSYCVVLRRAADNYLERCDAATRLRLKEKLETLKANPFDLNNSKPLKGRSDQRSARVGSLRILFRVTDAEIIVADIGPRGDIYKHGQ
jgi:mRNA-degrading endonuclease RelE of RelBE toxin-antitoxin system